MSASRKPAVTKTAAGTRAGREPAPVILPAVRKPQARGGFVAKVGFEQIFLIPPHERIAAIKRGVPAAQVSVLAEHMHIPKESLIATLRLSRATINRKARDKKPLSQDESERLNV